jgi:hypothetical protein
MASVPAGEQSTVSIAPVGSATPVPAMSKAQPWAAEANRTGTAIIGAAQRLDQAAPRIGIERSVDEGR